jgi:hypothetical protein
LITRRILNEQRGARRGFCSTGAQVTGASCSSLKNHAWRSASRVRTDRLLDALFIVYIDRGVMQLIEVVPVAAGLA